MWGTQLLLLLLLLRTGVEDTNRAKINLNGPTRYSIVQ
jgi:hypothetical protein